MSVLAILVLLLLVVAAGSVAALALAGRRQYEAQGQIVPGLASEAPAAWAGAHTEEARLHRRLGDAVRGLHAAVESGREADALLGLRVELEQQALEVDRRLVLAAALPGVARREALDRAAQAVAAIEAAAASLATEAIGVSAGAEDLGELTQRIRLAVEAREEIDALDAFAFLADSQTSGEIGTAGLTADEDRDEEPDGTPQASPG